MIREREARNEVDVFMFRLEVQTLQIHNFLLESRLMEKLLQRIANEE